MLKSATDWWHFDYPLGIVRSLEAMTAIEIDHSKMPYSLTWRSEWHPEDIEENRNRLLQSYRKVAAEYAPQLDAMLSGRRKVSEQRAFIEAWITECLNWREAESLTSLDRIISCTDIVNALLPSPEEVGWAFLQLKRRGWLIKDGSSYGLNKEGCRRVKAVIRDTAEALEAIKPLEEWMRMNRP